MGFRDGSEVKVGSKCAESGAQWGESQDTKNVTWSSPTLAILSRPSPPPLSHALQGFIIAFDQDDNDAGDAGDDADDGNGDDDDAPAC